MEPTKSLYEIFAKNDVSFFTGVPDSLLADLSSELESNLNDTNHVICPNEGSAIATALGNYAATKNIPVVYMQNSGLGNAINPLISLTHKRVWSIPMVLVIGWRGSYGSKDEPQHKQQGKVTPGFLSLLGIEYEIYNENNAYNIIKRLIERSKKKSSPVALLFKEKYKSPYNKIKKSFYKNKAKMSRMQAIKTVLNSLDKKDILISTTGKTSRELYLLQKQNKIEHADLFVVGGMGHASAIALGVLKGCENKKIFLLDGDGALLMHMGILSLLGKQRNNIFVHLLLNNEVHDSVGGQATAIKSVDIDLLSQSMNYDFYKTVKTEVELGHYLKKISKKKSSHFLNLKIKVGSTSPLPRPKDSPLKNFWLFQKKLKNEIKK